MWFFRKNFGFMFFCIFFFILYLSLLFMFCFSYLLGGLLLDFFLFSFRGFDVSLCIVFDYVSLGFFCCVSFICSVVFAYSLFYMEGTVDIRRFFWLVFGFVLSIFILVFSGNFFLTMVGWDGLGLVSFCLVIFYSNHSRLESGLVTVFRNRVGDVFFLLCFYFFFLLGKPSFDCVSNTPVFLFFVFLFLGAITKRAQLPFSSWLPAAIAAPTPVSSLVHSSTLVTAGVYVLVRFFYIFFFFNLVYLKLFFIITIIIAGICANLERDFKKVVAISTLRQLGMMLFILSVGVWLLSFLHMIIHAFFKRMLFLRTGSLIRHFGGGQDTRFYRSRRLSFFSFLFFLVRGVCLAGFPFYIGFYSKDLIIISRSLFLGILFYLVFLVGCIFTIFYRIRLVLYGYSFWVKGYTFSFFEENRSFFYPVAFLFLKAWLLGGMFYWFFLSRRVVFFSFFDIIAGLLLIFFCFLFYRYLLFFYKAFFFFGVIAFIRWFSARGSSFIFEKKNFHRWDRRWIEISGGQGIYKTLFIFSNYLDFFKKVGLGLLVIFVLSFSIGIIY